MWRYERSIHCIWKTEICTPVSVTYIFHMYSLWFCVPHCFMSSNMQIYCCKHNPSGKLKYLEETWAAGVGSQWLTVWAMVRKYRPVQAYSSRTQFVNHPVPEVPSLFIYVCNIVMFVDSLETGRWLQPTLLSPFEIERSHEMRLVLPWYIAVELNQK